MVFHMVKMTWDLLTFWRCHWMGPVWEPASKAHRCFLMVRHQLLQDWMWTSNRDKKLISEHSWKIWMGSWEGSLGNMESSVVSPGLLFKFVDVLKLTPSDALSWVTLRNTLWDKQMLHKLKSRFKQGASERWWVGSVLFLLCCFAFESEETISSSNFPSTQECDYLLSGHLEGWDADRQLGSLGFGFSFFWMII